MVRLEQTPPAGERLVAICGDTLQLELRVKGECVPGTAFVRTTLGRAAVLRAVETSTVDGGVADAGGPWQDVPMTVCGDGVFACQLPLFETGVFEAKCLLRPADGGESLWVAGENIQIKVEPACTAQSDTIYNAFVRQFGAYKGAHGRGEDCERAEQFLDGREYTVVPPSGRFRDVLRELPFIMDTLGFRIVQFLPVQPPPVTFARMGRYGSPFAPVDYFNVDASLADFDRRTTPLEQFTELVDGIHAHGGLVLLDLPIDHTGWASVLQVQHPEWFCREDDGRFASPGAWGVVWEDLCKLDFRHRGLWRYLAEVFLHWVSLGVDGFRCDAGYMVPAEVWRYITARVRTEYPDTLFFLEGLGGAPEVTRDLLDRGGMNWAYSELFQVFGADALKGYLGLLFREDWRHGHGVNYAETHDNARLAAVSPRWARMRTTLAALAAQSGAFGIANGVEWLATEKIDVHGASSLNWGAPENLIGHLSRLTQILRVHPAFGQRGRCRLAGLGTAVGFVRTTGVEAETVLVVLNPEEHDRAWLEWDEGTFSWQPSVVDLLGGETRPVRLRDGRWHLDLEPGEGVCLAYGGLAAWRARWHDENEAARMRGLVWRVVTAARGYGDVSDVDVGELAALLRSDVRAFLAQATGVGRGYLPLVEWQPGRDSRREVCVPPRHYLAVRQKSRFRLTLRENGKRLDGMLSCRCDDGSELALLAMPTAQKQGMRPLELELETWAQEKVIRERGMLLLLPTAEPRVNLRLNGEELTARHCGLCSNLRGGYALARARWGELHSKYDALLAANRSDDCPVDRTVALVRCRAWVVYRDYSMELSPACQTAFTAAGDGTLRWEFVLHGGQGQRVGLSAGLWLSREADSGVLTLRRTEAAGTPAELGDGERVMLIVRPDVDWRANHGVTKAFLGAEQAFREAVTAGPTGFRFAPENGGGLSLSGSRGSFWEAPEWHYQVPLSEDAERGLPSETDLFSPGYFRCELSGGQSFRLCFGVGDMAGMSCLEEPPEDGDVMQPLGACLRRGLECYLARRDGDMTVMAGFPWFLDWGRDTLICLRGLMAAGYVEECRNIIRAFAGFEENGTIPNMIRGRDSGDRATSDAPLWLFAAVEALMEADGEALLQMDCGGRPLVSILESIVAHCRSGMPNGVCCDERSGLLFSPSHFTWMDTNYPAGTPREGYPVEIQALWLHALAFMKRVTGRGCYEDWRRQAAGSFQQLFVRGDGRGLYDCLQGTAGTAAADCMADDAVRPNQLLAVTLEAGLPLAVQEAVVRLCGGLVVPGSIRSLDDAPVKVPHPVVRDGELLNCPERPYWGHYSGDEDRRRKPAYHNGTAWGWQLPLYCEALVKVYGESAAEAARCLLRTVAPAMRRGCVGQLPEIMDGDAPHEPRGCSAQAWSMCEAYRVWKLTMVN